MMIPMKLFVLSIFFLVASAQSYRLPKNVVPEQYTLDIISYLGEKDNFNFDGKVSIEIKCLQPTTNITLHSKDLEIDEKGVLVRNLVDDEKHPEVSGVKFDKENDFITITVTDSLKENQNYKVLIPFSGKLNDGLAGFYRSSYVDKATGEKKWLGVTQFEAISARRAFPCFDEPAMKAKFQINLGRKQGYSSISNMPLAKTEPMKEKEGWFWDHYKNSVPMSTYLVAFIISDFGYKTAEPGITNTTFNIWARKDALDQVEFAKEVGPKALAFFENYFGIPYPLPKQDMVAIPDFSAGAMENWGLITYREAYLLYDQLVSSSTNKHALANVIAHELAHQWFGNLVTMKWWTDLWLNEGFATYMAGLATDHLFPKWNSLQEESASNLIRVFSFDALKSSHPVSVPIGHPNEIDEIFDTISYKKGSFLIRMMGLFLGEETLRKGVSNYLKKHKYENAEQDDLWESLTEEAQNNGVLPKSLTVKTIMDSWTLQTGYPVVRVNRKYGTKTAEVTQQRFLRDINQLRSDTKSCWWIPLSYTNEKEHNFNVTTPKKWFPCPAKTETIEDAGADDEWLILNIRSAGLYRVNYDEQNWNMIIKSLQSPESFNVIPTLNRVQLIDDSSDLAWVGELKYDVVFNLLEYLKNEDEYLPWKSALSNLAELKRELRMSPAFGHFKGYIKQILTPIYNKLGGFILRKEIASKLDSIKHKVLITSWSCRYDVDNCIEDSKALFSAWENNPDTANPIHKDLRSIVYCNSLRNGGEKEWEFLWQHYLKSNVATEKNTILSSLGCTKEPWLLARYLEWSLDESSGIRRQDSSSVFSTVVSNDIGFYIAKDWFYRNIKKIREHLAPNSRRISRYLASLSHQMVSEQDFETLKKFIEENKDSFSEVKKGVEQALETVRVNVQWQQKHKYDIEKILEKHIKA